MALRGTASQANTSTSTTVVVTVTSIGILANDLVLLLGISGGSGTQTPTFPSGFTAITGLPTQNVDGSTLYAAYKVAGGSEPSSYTVTPGATDFHVLQCRVYSGRNTTAPFTAVQPTGPTAPSATPLTFALAGLTAAASDDICVFVGVEGADAVETLTFTAPTGYANTVTAQAGGTFTPETFSADKINVAAGSTGTLTASATASNAKTLGWGAFVISMAASGGGGGGHSNQGLLSLGVALSPLAWIIGRRNKLAIERRFEQDQKSRIFLSTYRKSR